MELTQSAFYTQETKDGTPRTELYGTAQDFRFKAFNKAAEILTDERDLIIICYLCLRFREYQKSIADTAQELDLSEEQVLGRYVQTARILSEAFKNGRSSLNGLGTFFRDAHCSCSPDIVDVKDTLSDCGRIRVACRAAGI